MYGYALQNRQFLKKIFYPSGSRQGYTLVEIIIVTGLLSVLVFGIVDIVQLQIKAMTNVELQATRVSLMASYRDEISNLNLIRASLHQPENTAFLGCVCGSPTPCAGGQAQPFSLYEPGDVSPVSNLKYFDASGLPCSSNQGTCILQVETKFLAQCLPTLPSATELPPGSCTTPAEFVGILVVIGPNPNLPASAIMLQSVQTAAYTQVTDIAPAMQGYCP